MTDKRMGIPAINKALAIIGIAVIAFGFWSVTVQVGTRTITFGGSEFVVGIYPYFTLGTVIVLGGMVLLASALIYSPRKLDARIPA